MMGSDGQQTVLFGGNDGSSPKAEALFQPLHVSHETDS